jgi:hypothetical protein
MRDGWRSPHRIDRRPRLGASWFSRNHEPGGFMSSAKTETGPTVKFAVAWFRRDDWRDLKRLCPDLEDTFGEWLANTKIGLQALKLSERDVDKVILTPDDLRDWRAANVGEINSQVRAKLAIELAMKRRED